MKRLPLILPILLLFYGCQKEDTAATYKSVNREGLDLNLIFDTTWNTDTISLEY